MKIFTKFGSAVAVAVISSGFSVYSNAACELKEVIQIADMSWSSASAIAHIESKIIEHGYGCKTELIPGDTVPTATTMVSKGRPHIAPELWSSNAAELLEEGEKNGTIAVAGGVFSAGGIDGWFIPKYVSDAYPDLTHAEDLARYSHLFEDPNDSEKGRFYNSLPGWSSEVRSTNLIRGYGLAEHYNLFSTGTGAALDAAIASNYKRKRPIVFFYWAPSAILGKYEMVQLKLNEFDPQSDSCNGEANCENPTAGGFPVVEVNTVVVNQIKDDAPSLYEFLKNVHFDNATVNDILAWGVDNRADPEEIAEYFLKNYQSVWTPWVPKEIAEKVIADI